MRNVIKIDNESAGLPGTRITGTRHALAVHRVKVF